MKKNPIYKVWHNGKKTEESYEEICHTLGFIADVHFVQVTTAGTICFTCGKPHEIRSLREAIERKGYRPSKYLQNLIL